VSVRVWLGVPEQASRRGEVARVRWVGQAVSRQGQVPGRDRDHFEVTLPKAPTGPVWLLVSADAEADPSNLRLGAAQKPPTDAAELRELVAHDNNLGLICLAR